MPQMSCSSERILIIRIKAIGTLKDLLSHAQFFVLQFFVLQSFSLYSNSTLCFDNQIGIPLMLLTELIAYFYLVFSMVLQRSIDKG